jgi:hypothetical protein
MSGIQSHLKFDECYAGQQVGQMTKQFLDYDFLIDKYENRKSTNTVATCDGKYAHIECKSCLSNDNVMDNTRTASLTYRLDVEGDLLGLTRPATLCDGGKFKPCYMSDTKCDQYKAISQPILCDRLIVPTNMKPFKSAFEY